LHAIWVSTGEASDCMLSWLDTFCYALRNYCGLAPWPCPGVYARIFLTWFLCYHVARPSGPAHVLYACFLLYGSALKCGSALRACASVICLHLWYGSTLLGGTALGLHSILIGIAFWHGIWRWIWHSSGLHCYNYYSPFASYSLWPLFICRLMDIWLCDYIRWGLVLYLIYGSVMLYMLPAGCLAFTFYGSMCT